MSLNPKTKAHSKLVKRLANEIRWQHQVTNSGELTIAGINAAVAKIRPDAPRHLIENAIAAIIDDAHWHAGYAVKEAARHKSEKEAYQTLLAELQKPALRIVGGTDE